MRSAENIPPVSGVVASELPKILPAANAEAFISPDDLRRRGWWANKDGVRVRVDADEVTLTEYTPGAKPVLQGSLEEIAVKLREEGFIFFPIEGKAAEENRLRVPVREEDVPRENTVEPDLEKRLLKAQELDEKIDQSTKEAEAILENINSILSEAGAFSQEEGFEAIRTVLDDITSQVTEKIERVNDLSSADDIANESLVIDEAYVEGKQKRFEKLQILCGEMDTLSEHAAQALTALKKLSVQANEGDREAAGITLGTNGDAADTLGGGSGETEKPLKRKKKAKGGGSGSDGGDGEDGADLPKDPKAVRQASKRARLLAKQERQQAEGVPVVAVDATEKEVPASETPSAEPEPVVAEVPATDTSWRKELDAFLERPKAREKVVMIEDIIREEWDEFSGYTHKESLKMGRRLSRQDQMALWQDKGLPALEEMVARHLNTFDSIDLEEGKKIFLAILRNLEEEAKKQQ